MNGDRRRVAAAAADLYRSLMVDFDMTVWLVARLKDVSVSHRERDQQQQQQRSAFLHLPRPSDGVDRVSGRGACGYAATVEVENYVMKKKK